RTVDGDVLVVTLLELLHRLADHVHAAVLAHRLGGEVGVRARAIPVALHRLWIQRGADAEILGYAIQQPAREPQLVGHFRRPNRADLKLPLSRHYLGIGSDDVDAGAQAGLGVRFDDVAAEHLVCADAAVVAP